MPTVRLTKPTGFSLAAAAEFYAGFIPGCGMASSSEPGRLRLAFLSDGTYQPVAVSLVERAASIEATFAGGGDGASIAAQVGRMLGLDAGAGWLQVGERDATIGALQASFPGFFTAAKPSPYDAATWGVIVPRMNMRAAAKVKQAIAREHGTRVELDGLEHHVFPAPEALLRVEAVEGLPQEKLERLHGVAEAALEGRLDVARLRAMGEEEALASLMRLRGVGPWTASHIYHRGAAPTDALPLAEPRVLHGFAEAFGGRADEAAFLRASEAWRPYRMWVCILLARHLGRSGGWHRPGLVGERAAASRRVAQRASRARPRTAGAPRA